MHCLRIGGISIFYKAPQIDLKYFSQFDIISIFQTISALLTILCLVSYLKYYEK